MPKKLLIFSDGTGQAGGIFFDERRSNIYKMYRATRVCPDSSIDPAEQIAFYDAGLGSKPPSGSGFVPALVRRIYNLVSQATGLGITANMVDCYAFIIRHWQPGDRIFLFGFSRGAYTVRCLGGALGMCGVPTIENGEPIKRDVGTARRLARHAINDIYQYTTSWRQRGATPRQEQLLKQRKELAERFRRTHASGTADKSNAYPHFIGVFDTVASIANKNATTLLAVTTAVIVCVLAGAASWVFGLPWRTVVPSVVGVVALIAFGLYLYTHVKWAKGLKDGFWQTLHRTELKQRFDDTDLNENVPYARHAISIDESRADFQRVKWGSPRSRVDPADSNDIQRFEQVWFAGVHSDIGGSYPETESRLSDIALQWMIDAAKSVPNGIKVDGLTLRTYPSPDGMQHDEVKDGLGPPMSLLGLNWKTKIRDVPKDAVLHPTVYARLGLQEVLHHDVHSPYRPAALKDHHGAQEHIGRVEAAP